MGRKEERKAEIEERKNALRTYNAEDHINEAEQLIEQGERQGTAPAAISCYSAATAHATLAIAKATQGRT